MAVGLMCACASHVTSVKRLQLLRAMLTSWSRGSIVPHMFLSVSWTPDVGAVVASVLDDMERIHGDKLKVARQPRPLSQFEHFRATSAKLEMVETAMLAEIWVMFSDDDDLWHEERAAVAAEYVLCTAASPHGKDTLFIRMNDAALGDCDGMTQQDVEDAVAAGGMRLAVGGGENEYWMFVVRQRSLADFVRQADPELLHHPYCDTYFVRYLEVDELDGGDGRRRLEVGHRGGRWLYAYRGTTFGHGGRVTDSAAQGRDPDGLEEVARNAMIAMYRGLPRRRRGLDFHAAMAPSIFGVERSLEKDAVIATGSLMVARGDLDAFVFSPAPRVRGGY